MNLLKSFVWGVYKTRRFEKGVPAHEYLMQLCIVEKVQFVVYCKVYVLILVNYVIVYAVGNLIVYTFVSITTVV